jgi:hypothetical protein
MPASIVVIVFGNSPRSEIDYYQINVTTIAKAGGTAAVAALPFHDDQHRQCRAPVAGSLTAAPADRQNVPGIRAVRCRFQA